MRSFSVKLTNAYYRLLCRVQGVLMATRLNATQYVSVIVGLAVVILEFVTGIGDDLLNLNSLVLILGFIAVLAPALNELFELHRNNVSYTITSSDSYHDDVLTRLELSPDYEKAGYEKLFYDDCGTEEGHVDSAKVNRYLFQGSVDRERAIHLVHKKATFRIPEEVRPLVIGIIQRMLRKYRNRRLFNGSLVRLSSDIFPGKTSEATVQKVHYFDGQCTQELAFKRASYADNAEKNFKGEIMLMNDDNQLLELWESHCANFIGISTMAITKDGYMLVGLQGGQSMANANRFAPPGSGSTEYSDLKLLQSNKTDFVSLQDLVSYAAERELHEESAIPEGVPMRTYVIGFTRLLERGGDCDFFCITFMDITVQDVLDNFDERQRLSEVALGSKPLAIPIPEGTRVSDALYGFMRQVREEQPDQHRISIQLQLSADCIAAVEDMPEWEIITRK